MQESPKPCYKIAHEHHYGATHQLTLKSGRDAATTWQPAQADRSEHLRLAEAFAGKALFSLGYAERPNLLTRFAPSPGTNEVRRRFRRPTMTAGETCSGAPSASLAGIVCSRE